MNDILYFCLATGISLIIVYTAARLASAAIYKSKQEHLEHLKENKKHE